MSHIYLIEVLIAYVELIVTAMIKKTNLFLFFLLLFIDNIINAFS